MQRLQFLSSISGLVALSLSGGCGDDSCGPGGAQDAGLLASSADVVLNYGDITSGPNHDCPDPDAPDVEPLTLQGTQIDGPGLLTLCIPRPDLLQKGELQLGTSVFIIDLNGEVDACTYALERLRPVTGAVSATGLCDNGTNPAGYALTVDGALSLKRTCATAMDTIAVTFTGTVAIAATP